MGFGDKLPPQGLIRINCFCLDSTVLLRFIRFVTHRTMSYPRVYSCGIKVRVTEVQDIRREVSWKREHPSEANVLTLWEVPGLD